MDFNIGDKVRLVKKCSHSCHICRQFYNEIMEIASIEYGISTMTNCEMFENYQLELVTNSRDYANGF